ncbi:hypothetical protein [Cellulosilyticum sp. I15G10I2]|nr:hypothetical protein [Cellulosilyticum sp. I15G10I2]
MKVHTKEKKEFSMQMRQLVIIDRALMVFSTIGGLVLGFALK